MQLDSLHDQFNDFMFAVPLGPVSLTKPGKKIIVFEKKLRGGIEEVASGIPVVGGLFRSKTKAKERKLTLDRKSVV